MIQIEKYNHSNEKLTAFIACKSTRFGKISMIAQQQSILFCSFLSPDVLLNEVHINNPLLQVMSGFTDEMERAFQFIDGVNNQKITLSCHATDFQIAVWNEILKTPFGKTTTYKKIAMSLENEKSIRAVGAAVGANEHAILIPCHRVLYSDGHSGKFRWGSDLKIQLLLTEKNLPFVHSQLF